MLPSVIPLILTISFVLIKVFESNFEFFTIEMSACESTKKVSGAPDAEQFTVMKSEYVKFSEKICECFIFVRCPEQCCSEQCPGSFPRPCI